jgi:hypothetical protein
VNKQKEGFAPILIILIVVVVIGVVFLLGKGKINSVITIGTPAPTTTSLLETVDLPVQQLVTTFGVDGMPMPTYPKTVKVHVLQGFGSQLAAYGAANQIVIAPKNWTGTGLIGATGGLSVDLHPMDISQKSQITVHIPSSGTGEVAYEYYQYTEGSGSGWTGDVPPPVATSLPGLKSDSTDLTSRLAKYSLPDTKEGLEVRGVLYSDIRSVPQSQQSLQREQITIPKEQDALLQVLLNAFIDQQGLRTKS